MRERGPVHFHFSVSEGVGERSGKKQWKNWFCVGFSLGLFLVWLGFG